MAKIPETPQSLTRFEPNDDIQAMADAHEAESLLFHYIITSAGQLETPPVILKKLAANLGDPQRLPAAKLLQTTTEHPLSHPLTTLISIEGLLEGTFEDSAETFEKELEASEKVGHSHSPWVSITFEKRADETLPNDITSTTPLASDPLIDRKPQKILPIGRILFLSFAIVYGCLAYKTGQFFPTAIFDVIKHTGLTQPAEDSPSAIPSKATDGVSPPTVPQDAPTPQTPPVSQEDSPLPLSPERPQGQNAENHPPVAPSRQSHTKDPDEHPQPEASSDDHDAVHPLSKTPPELMQNHPGVVSLPEEEPDTPSQASENAMP